MSLLPQKPDQIKEGDLLALVSNQVAEGKTIEYKQELPGGTDSDKKEFLADVSSFANTVGGHILYGISDNDGLPRELMGVASSSSDQQILRLEEIIRTGIEPRVKVSSSRITLKNKQDVYVIYIPRSWQPPHRISFKNDGKFYARNSRGKYQLDISEIRAAFALSETSAERIQNFRAERLSKIKSGDTPVDLPDGARIVIHACPLNLGDPLPNFDISNLMQQTRSTDMFKPFYSFGWSYRPNLDGFATYSNTGDGKAFGYLQVFRNGCVEAVSANLTNVDARSGYIPSIAYEKEIMAEAKRMIDAQNFMDVEMPIFCMVSLLGVKGYRMGVDEFNRNAPDKPYIDRDDLVLPEIKIESYEADMSKALRPTFDAVWNSAGWQRSWNYDEKGDWVGRG